jgi:MFS family permease
MTADTLAARAATDAAEPHRDSVLEVMAASMIGTAIEFYDNYCYSIAAASYFGLVFFTDVAKSNPFLATLLSFVTFAVSFLARPFGSLLFGHFGDRLGRKQTLVMALMMMGTATFVVGVLPGYERARAALAVVLLCVCRACQGLGLAGEWSGAALVATENAPANKRALWGSFPNLGAPLGFFFAYGVNLMLESNLTNDQMVAWGWRIPFLLSAVLVVVGLVVRNRMSETPVFQKAVKEDRVVKSPLKELRKYWKQVVLGTCAMGITYTLFYLLGTWSLSYGVKTLGFAQTDFPEARACRYRLLCCLHRRRLRRGRQARTPSGASARHLPDGCLQLLRTPASDDAELPCRLCLPRSRLCPDGRPLRSLRCLPA